MCFEWDKRYFRELAERQSKEKADELIRRSQEAAHAGPQGNAAQPAHKREQEANA